MKTTQLRRVFLALAVAFYIVCMYRSEKTPQSESEAWLLLQNHVSVHVGHQMRVPRLQRRRRLILLMRELLSRCRYDQACDVRGLVKGNTM